MTQTYMYVVIAIVAVPLNFLVAMLDRDGFLDMFDYWPRWLSSLLLVPPLAIVAFVLLILWTFGLVLGGAFSDARDASLRWLKFYFSRREKRDGGSVPEAPDSLKVRMPASQSVRQF